MEKIGEEKSIESVFFIDFSALKDMFNGENKDKSAELLKKLKEINDKGMKFKALTTSANFLRAIWLADPNAKINSIQKTLSFLDVGFSMANFRNEEEVINETLKIAEMMSHKKEIKPKDKENA